MRRCELCKRKARMFCASDRATLCWDCDAAVHYANFLVARHSRNLLCSVCQSPTLRNASGGKIRPTVSVCEQCAAHKRCEESIGEESETEVVTEESQVVPCSPPPLAESSCSDDESVGSEDAVISRKRLRFESDPIGASSHLSIRAPPRAAAEASSRSKRRASLQEVQAMDSSRVNVRGSEILDSLPSLEREEKTVPDQEMVKNSRAPSI